MTKEEAIRILKSMNDISTQGEAIDMAIEALQTEAVRLGEYRETYGVVTIEKQNANEVGEIKHIVVRSPNYTRYFYNESMPTSAEAVHKPDYSYEADMVKRLKQADAVQGWRIGKPTEQGKYMVTLDSFGHKHIDLFYYGKPLMPNRKVRGKCWYRSDDEWGDVVYDDKDIIAWIPLPKPYTKGDNDEER